MPPKREMFLNAPQQLNFPVYETVVLCSADETGAGSENESVFDKKSA